MAIAPIQIYLILVAGLLFVLLALGIYFWKSKEITKLELGENWLPNRKHLLTLHLPDCSLNRINLGDLYESLRPLGRPDNPSPLFHARFSYHLSGLEISLNDKTVSGFTFLFKKMNSEIQSCRLKLIAGSNDYGLDSSTTLTSLKPLLTQGVQEEQLADGSTLLLDVCGKHELEFHLDSSGFLQSLEISDSMAGNG